MSEVEPAPAFPDEYTAYSYQPMRPEFGPPIPYREDEPDENDCN